MQGNKIIQFPHSRIFRRPMATPVSRPSMATPIRRARKATFADVSRRLERYIRGDSQRVRRLALDAALSEFYRSGEVIRSVNAGCVMAMQSRNPTDPNGPSAA